MSDQVEMTNPVDQSIVFVSGHLLRRGIHLGMSFIPVLFFEFGEDVADTVKMSLEKLVSLVILVAIVGEALRLKLGVTIVGQRAYEAKYVSTLAWGAISIGLVLLLVPNKAYVYPLILCLFLGNPLLGEMRGKIFSVSSVICAGTIGVALIWAGCEIWAGTLWLLVPLMAPICGATK